MLTLDGTQVKLITVNQVKKAILIKKAPSLLRVLFVGLLALLLIPSKTLAATIDTANGDVATIKGLEGLIANLISIALSLSGLILFIMFVIGGFKYLTSQGDPKSVEAAKGTLTHAIIGLVILLLAYVILSIVYGITGVDVRNFRVTK
jgi:amino acid permease